MRLANIILDVLALTVFAIEWKLGIDKIDVWIVMVWVLIAMMAHIELKEDEKCD